MNGRFSQSDILSNVTPRALRAYVEAHGWHKVEPYGDYGDVYAFGNEPSEIIVPISSRFTDYGLSIGQVITILANMEEREEDAVLRDLSLADVDLIRVRLPESRADGSISIDMAAAMIQQSRNMLLAAACSALRPQRVFRIGKNKRAKDYVSAVRLGQTERGSFIINILSPAPPELGTNMAGIPTAEPFPRKVVRKLGSGLQATREAVDLADYEYRETDLRGFADGVDVGVSANLCEALVGMLGKGNESGLDISVSWALTYPYPRERARVQFDESDVQILEKAYRVLREPQDHWPEQFTLLGRVTSLVRQDSDHRGSVRIRGEIDGSIRSVRVEFDPEDYLRVVQAHAWQRVISVRGDLMREGQRWTLENPRDLMVHYGVR